MVTSNYLIDTNIFIDFLSGKKQLDKKFKELNIIIPAIVTGELYYGAELSNNPQRNLRRIKYSLQYFDILAIDEITSTYYAKVKKHLKLKGKPIPENDVWIGALALQYDLILVTDDQHLEEIDKLKIQKW
jgi:tRNA(fMet)-specific endonuclease VapC